MMVPSYPLEEGCWEQSVQVLRLRMQKEPLTVFVNRLIFPPNFTAKISVIVSFLDVIRFNLAIHAQSEEG